MILRVIVLGIIGPAVALFATWYEAVTMARIGTDEIVPTHIVERLRETPSAAVLSEIDRLALGALKFENIESKSIIANAENVLAGHYDFGGVVHSVNVPFKPTDDLFGKSTWQLRLSGFLIPSLLVLAFEVSGDDKYLRAAVDYVIDWSDFENSLFVPRGTFFNDHATAARAVVMTQVWRLYRDSQIFSMSKAIRLLQYIQKLSRMLQNDRLYSYPSNHGLMQNLSLLHVAIAFPLLNDAEKNIDIGTKRLLSQLRYYINSEGVILEHSPGYHHNFLDGLSAAWRYLTLVGQPVPDGMADRYRRAFEFEASMSRPDGTLPPIGDTRDSPYGPLRNAPLNDELLSSALVEVRADEKSKPGREFLAPAAGYGVIWNGLEHWPQMAELSQTVLTWANFPAKSHKHDDELSIALWSAGTQWVRGVGYWPYNASRPESIGWRSSNAPHWIGELSLDSRSLSLEGSTIDEALAFFDVARENPDGSSVRRQIAIVKEGMWVILDSFSSVTSNEAELIWRFSPDLALKQLAANVFALEPESNSQSMTISFKLPAESTIEADYSGEASWNSGLVSGYDIVSSSAIRLVSAAKDPVLTTVFRLKDIASNANTDEPREIIWETPDRWKLVIAADNSPEIEIQRDGSRLQATGVEDNVLNWEILSAYSKVSYADRKEAVDAFEEASRYYGRPFRASFERRIQTTYAVIAGIMLQIFLLYILRNYYRRLWPAAVFCVPVAWIGVSVFISLYIFP